MRILALFFILLTISACGKMMYPELYREDGTGGWNGQYAAFDGVDYEDFRTFILTDDLDAVLSYTHSYPSQTYSYITIERLAKFLNRETAESEWFNNYIHQMEEKKTRNPHATHYSEDTLYTVLVVNHFIQPKLIELAQQYRSTELLLRALVLDMKAIGNRYDLRFSNRDKIFNLITLLASEEELVEILTEFFTPYDPIANRHVYRDAFKSHINNNQAFVASIKNNYLNYLLSGDSVYLTAHMAAIKQGRAVGDARFFKDYFIYSVQDFTNISRFFNDLKFCDNCDTANFHEAISRAEKFGYNLTLTNFMSSNEYRHFFNQFGYKVAERTKGSAYGLVVTSNKNSVSVELAAQTRCDKADQLTRKERIGFFEGIGLSISNPNQYASEKFVTYQNYRCQVQESDKRSLIQISQGHTAQLNKGLHGFNFRDVIGTNYVWSDIQPTYVDDSSNQPMNTVSSRPAASNTSTNSTSSVSNFYDGGYRSSAGYPIMIVECRNKGRFSVYYDRNDGGQWKDAVGSAYGSQFRGVPLNRSTAERFCNSR
ncbi:hypothetical protein [Nitrincola sp. MINF-07-Sa-05]|uniref:hypothetical protein n=1 Tax=Nitrincola salilacus TaxID=3400273 RepID=UPI00391858F3